MQGIRVYKLAFAPLLVALVVLAFSVEGVPEPAETPPVTLAFEQDRAATTARALVAQAPDRAPGSEGDAAAADFVRERFTALESGAVSEQELDADVEGEDVTLRNVVLTLPGQRDRTIVVVAGRDSLTGPGAASSAAATATLLELAQQLGVSERQSTIVLASTAGASAGAPGVRELLASLDPDVVEGVIAISQPGADELAPPHVVTSSAAVRSAPLALLRTAEAQLAERAHVQAGTDGPLGQLARLALPGAVGEQAAASDEGFDALAISAAGELPLPPERDVAERLDPETLASFGTALFATIAATDAATDLEESPDTYLLVGGTVVPGWAVALLALALVLPAVALAAVQLARASRDGEAVAPALRWAGRWAVLPLGAVLAILALGLVGLVPDPGVPYDPTRFAIGPAEAVALVALVGGIAAAWWLWRLRVRPGDASIETLAAACAAVAAALWLIAWFANPFLALLLVPLVHVAAIHATQARAAGALTLLAAFAASVPLLAALVHVASELDWGISTPWQLVLLIAGGGAGPVATAACLGVLGATAALVWATLAPREASPRRAGEAPQATAPGRTPAAP